MVKPLMGLLWLCLLMQQIGLAALPEPVLAGLKAAKLPAGALGAVVLPVDGGPARLEHQADTAFNPASTIKLLSTLAALETLGPTFQWRTAFYTDGQLDGDILRGNLYLRGSGDPKLTYERVWLLLRDLRARGVRQVSGELLLDRSYFRPDADAADGAIDEQAERAYNVAPDALLLNFKALRFDIAADAKRVSVRIDPPLAGVQAESRMKLVDGDCESWTQGWARPEIVKHADGRLAIALQGRFPRHCHGSRYLGLLEPAEFADRLVRGLWTELGGAIVGGTREAPLPSQARLLVEQYSPPLGELIRDINKLSNNTMARGVYLTLGAEYARANPAAIPLSSQQSADLALQAWLNRKGQSYPELVMDNGAGLSRIARISPRHLAGVLALGHAGPFAPEYAASLPIVGLDGTMRKRLPNSSLAGSARIKTGTLDDVKAVAGYVRDSAGRDWVVVGLINHPRAEYGQAALDALLEWAAR
ncbi:D-alanyl-D-alanine carboxypeptidase/D-alanyl-D-alanine endopeptidase [Chitinimonas arctica]|nr:D-alanyl-D-alanine carboxypeptidase/D-alanyl-D-alanine-endopeptidase [Chitinimonas arctica]